MKAIKSKQFIYTTPNVFDDEEAIFFKMKRIHPKLFGLFCPVQYKLVSKEKVCVPYEFMVFHYTLRKSAKPKDATKKGFFDKEGEVALVYDLNEMHPFHFDLFDHLDLKKKAVDSLEGRMMKANCSGKQALDDSVECIKWQYLRKVFHHGIPDIALLKRERFYREAWRLTLISHGKTFEKFAYKDNFGAENEHIAGLKVRLTTT